MHVLVCRYFSTGDLVWSVITTGALAWCGLVGLYRVGGDCLTLKDIFVDSANSDRQFELPSSN